MPAYASMTMGREATLPPTFVTPAKAGVPFVSAVTQDTNPATLD